MRSGDVVGDRFRIENLAGSGGMGSVWRALDRRTGVRVALKILHGRDPRDAARFLREAQVIAGLDHPGIVRFVADGQLPEGEPFLVMEWLEGENLADRLERRPLTLAETLALGRHTAEALGAMHAHGVVHRDLKPGNLFLVDHDPERIKVIDFGIARRDFGPELTRTGVLLGTPGFIAPEQALGDRNVDARADVFALGCVLFKCLAGEGAYGGEDDLTVLLRVVKGTARRVRELVPQIPQEIDDLIAAMLARMPNDRPRDAAIVAAMFRRFSQLYGDGRPGDDPLDELVTTRGRAVAEPIDEISLGSTSPFPLTVPRGGEASRSFEVNDDDTSQDEDDDGEILTEPGRAGEGGAAFAAGVARAIAAVEEKQRRPEPPPSPLPRPLPPPLVGARPVTPPPAKVPPSLVGARPVTPPPAKVPPSLVGARPVTPPPAKVPPSLVGARPVTPPPAPVPPSIAAAAPQTVFEEGADPRVLQYLRSAESFLKQNDFRNALKTVRYGIEAGARGEVYGALRTRQAEAHRWRGELVDAERVGSDAMGSLTVGSEFWWLAAREAVLSAGARGDAAKVGMLAEEMMRILHRIRPDAASVGTLTCTATYLMHAGHTERLNRFLRWAEPLTHNLSKETPAVAARIQQMQALRAIHEGNLGAYLLANEASAERFAAAGDMRNSLTMRVNVGFAKVELGAYGHAEADLRAGIAGAERMGLNHVVLAARANLGVVLAKRGDAIEARTILLEVLKESVSEGDRRFEASARTHLSFILLTAGDVPGSVREARGAVEMTLAGTPARAFALGALARAQLMHERPMAALEAAEQAMEVLYAVGGIEEGESLVRLAFAKAKRQLGDVEGACAAIAAARDRLMTRAKPIADPAFRTSFLRDVFENAETLGRAHEWLEESSEWAV